jgi:hypothetical protein
MNIKSTIELFAGQSGGSSLLPRRIEDTPAVRDIARKRLVRPFASPDVDAQHYKEGSQKDNATFSKKYRVVDTKYGHEISEHDSSEEAHRAALARPYSKVMSHPDPAQLQVVRNMKRKSVTNVR